MTCFYCKGNIESSTTTYMTDYQGCYIIIKNVPCEKCSQCGEEYLNGETLERIEEIMNYEQLLTAADQEGLLVKEQPLTEHDGLIRGSRIAIRKDIETQAEKSCVLAEEIGHYRTSSGNILDQNKVESRKQEYRARLYGYNLKIGLAGLIRAYEAGCGNL